MGHCTRPCSFTEMDDLDTAGHGAGQAGLVPSFEIVKDRDGEKRGQRVRIVFDDADGERRFMAALEREAQFSASGLA
jgi:hypothetical protein